MSLTYECPECTGEGHLIYETLSGGWSRGYLLEEERPCHVCCGRGEVEDSSLMSIELPNLLWMLGRRQITVERFAEAVVDQSCMTGLDPIGTYGVEWSEWAAGNALTAAQIEARIESEYEIRRAWKAA